MGLFEKERIGEPESLLIEAGMVLSKIRMLGYKQDFEVLSGFFENKVILEIFKKKYEQMRKEWGHE